MSYRFGLELIAGYDFDADYCGGWKNAARTMQAIALSRLEVAKPTDLPPDIYKAVQQQLPFYTEEGKRTT